MLEITLAKVDNFEDLGRCWRDLEARSNPSFFQSWHWSGCLAAERFSNPVVLKAADGDHVLALGLFNHSRRIFGPSLLWLGESGDPERDEVFIEHNGLLVVHTRPELAADCLAVAYKKITGPGGGPFP